MDVLLVEDEDSIAEPLAEGLRNEGFNVARVATGADALAAPPGDIVLLDLRLPDTDGFSVCRKLRERTDVPIIIVSARGEEVDRVIGLELGADDYIVKPFGAPELLARVRTTLRNARGRTDAAVTRGRVEERARHEAELHAHREPGGESRIEGPLGAKLRQHRRRREAAEGREGSPGDEHGGRHGDDHQDRAWRALAPARRGHHRPHRWVLRT